MEGVTGEKVGANEIAGDKGRKSGEVGVVRGEDDSILVLVWMTRCYFYLSAIKSDESLFLFFFWLK